MAFRQMKIIIGFVILFAFYHGAEYFVLFHYQPMLFFLLQLLFFVTAILIAKWQGFSGLGAWGLTFSRNWLKQLSAGMLMGILLYGITFLISLGLRSEEVIRVPPLSSMLGPLALFWFGNLFSSFSEDILTRGYLYRHLNGNVSIPSLVFLSALIYVLNHIYRLGDGIQTWSYLFALGLLFIIPLVLTKKLWFTGGLHWMGNTTFYFTHNVIEVKSNATTLSANTILLLCILFFIPLTIGVIRMFRFDTAVNTKLS